MVEGNRGAHVSPKVVYHARGTQRLRARWLRIRLPLIALSNRQSHLFDSYEAGWFKATWQPELRRAFWHPGHLKVFSEQNLLNMFNPIGV
ncbi:uncharacterized protein N7487_003064 [Penicillium crustosum]|uniref:uncharacterized protein n=1 Tax=Penicillium crustosum TaxID=36656 RepID=UPI0023A44497|nr:uncharacterized protein N7487_003064 [Penicillium crustosum]KAJ5419514.1 hypothetical protein N7487_003064 [Penicillium crustosum]